MIIAYIAHPISGDVEKNLADLKRIVFVISAKYSDIVPFIPYFVFASIPNFNNELALKYCLAFLQAGCADEFWLTGSKLSEGMSQELLLAAGKGLKIRNYLNKL